MAAARETRTGRIFGLSIAEEVEWGVGEAFRGMLVGVGETGRFADIPAGNLPHGAEASVQIEAAIRACLVGLSTERPDLFRDVTAIGVSTIGVVDRTEHRLDSIRRKNWVPVGKGLRIIEFRKLFLEQQYDGTPLFERVTSPDQIVVQNDASALCKTEYLYNQGIQGDDSSLLYIAVGEGVNGALVRGGDILQMARHSEMGHILPQLHPLDRDFPEALSGCPSHGTCFEGVASTARVRRQWGADLSALPEDHPAWEIEAFYLAQLAMIGVLSLNPGKILFGGSVFSGSAGLRLIDRIRAEFLRRNADYLPDYRGDRAASVEALIDRGKFGRRGNILAALTMGCGTQEPATLALLARMTELRTHLAEAAHRAG